MARRRNKGEERNVATRRIGVLLERARSEADGPDADLAPRHVRLARRIAMKYQMALPGGHVEVCKACDAVRTSHTSRVRLRQGRVITTCLSCGAVRRRPLGDHP